MVCEHTWYLNVQLYRDIFLPVIFKHVMPVVFRSSKSPFKYFFNESFVPFDVNVFYRLDERQRSRGETIGWFII